MTTSNQRVIEALIETRNTDWDNETRIIASRSLSSPVHDAFVQQNPALLAAVRKNGQVHLQARPYEQPTPDVERPPSEPSLSWVDTWRMAVIKPSVATYERIASDPKATRNRAYKWLFLSGLVWLSLLNVLGISRRYGNAALQTIFSGAGLGAFIALLLFAVFAVLGIVLLTLITQFIARLVGGKGSYARLLYVTAAYSCPMQFVSFALTNLLVSQAALITSLITLYDIVLALLSVKAVHRLGWARTVIAVMVVQAAFWGLSLLTPTRTRF